MTMRILLLVLLLLSSTIAVAGKTRVRAPVVATPALLPAPVATPQFRPAYHFTPAAHWMNDPNGMVFYKGLYHLFFQYFPGGMTWGPMHWGHATSVDLVRWTEQDIALTPDDKGMIFSGSVVVDANNTSGLGKDGVAPLVAVFTLHDAKQAARPGSITHETQGIAYSLDDGQHWTKYADNPVLANPGMLDFRDPKVRWMPESKRWLMSLATGNRIAFYSSPDLKDWRKESEFGENVGDHSGTWECPDLFPLRIGTKTRWVLLVSMTTGGPNGGSATQYFIGDFDGHAFKVEDTQVKWIDYGPDDYAGVTWGNTGDRALFLGWMGNWDYAKEVPTSPWRSAMTLPRQLLLRRVGGQTYLASMPAAEVQAAFRVASTQGKSKIGAALDLSAALEKSSGKFSISLRTRELRGFRLRLGNAAGDELLLGYDQGGNRYFIDRSNAGDIGFSPKFTGVHWAPRLATATAADLSVYFDAASVELFADQGLSVMTSVFFPRQPFTKLAFESEDGMVLEQLSVSSFAGAVARQ
jgi:fructan beta-fructosidase